MTLISKAAAGRLLILVTVCLGTPALASPHIYIGTPSSYLALLRELRPGDTLALSSGDYPDGLPLHQMLGEPGKPIVVRGPPSKPFARFIARRGRHTVSIVNSAYIEVRNLELDGVGLPVAAVRAEGHSRWAHHITLENLLIKGHGEDQQIAGIATFCPAWGWVIRNNMIIGAGTGMYLGQSDGTAPFVAGLIERNVIIESIGYNLQIKHQNERPTVPGMPEAKSATIIRHNVFAKSSNSSSGEMARPNLLVGHWPLSGPGAEDTYVIYGNFFYQNPSEALFQGEGNIAFYSNVMVNTLGDAMHIQAHNAVPRRIDVFHNTIVAQGTGIRVSGGDPAFAQRVIANAVFASAPIVGGEQHVNKTGLPEEAADNLAAPFARLGQLNLAPKPGKLITTRVRFEPQFVLPDVDHDFEGRVYNVPVAGAYAGAGARRLRIEIKP